ncbi:MAG: hypothetical protein QOH08_1759 [Chloroflexota bacterium]|nr:hypothetical protein [Chloroflexota bacterium]
MGGSRRVLVVDDDPEIRRLVSEILASAGYDVQTAVDGDHALRSAIALRPDLIILDVHVPDAAMAIRFSDRYRERVPSDQRAPIVALSGAPDLETAGQRLGAAGFLAKPFELEDLLRLAAKHLAPPVVADEVAAGPAEEDPAAPIVPIAEPGVGTSGA